MSRRAAVKGAQRVKRRGEDSFEPRKVLIKGRVYWQVNLPLRFEGEKRIQERKTYKEREQADTAAELARIQAKNQGRNSFAIPDIVRTDALAATRLLEPLGVTILEAAKFYADHRRQIETSEKVSVVVKELLAARQHDELRPRYLKDLRVRLNRFSQSFGERKIATISAGEINAWLRALGLKPNTRNAYRGRLSVLLSYAIERGWAKENPLRGIKKLKVTTTIGILTPEQFAKVLETTSEETLPYWIIGGFAGLRRAEIERLEWKDVHFDLEKYRTFTAATATGNKEAIAKAEKEWRAGSLIEVPAIKSKTASRRFVQIQDGLAAWLEPYIGRTGPICPLNLRNLLEIDRVKAGVWAATERALKATAKQLGQANVKLKPWPSNGLRHSFASYHLAHFKDAARLALELGHTDQELLFRHYRELVTPESAEKYWNIRPATQTDLVAISA
ncbi:MAG: hypothetical protein C5B58_15325 [Acidobacteria bacterium]|nr:MAG: hypothetical protein C5B58_15325 [Acidobacteriota bacterium]